MTRHELLTRMSSQELSDWMVYERVEPFGQERAAMALLTALTANIYRDPRRKPTAYTPDDFLFASDADEIPVEQRVAAAFGAPTG